MAIVGDFKAFIARGNVLDLAVGVIIGAGFSKIVSSLTDDIIMPIIGKVTGGVDFSSKFLILGAVPAAYKGSMNDYAALKKAGVAMLGYGSFMNAVINFFILAVIIFMIVRQAAKVMPPRPVAPTGPSEVDLLTEIRDSLKAR